MKKTLNDALLLIQRAETSVVSNSTDTSYCEAIQVLVERLKQQLSQDFSLPEQFFDPVDPDLVPSEEPSDEVLQPDDPQLQKDAARLYDELETSIGFILLLPLSLCLSGRAFFVCHCEERSDEAILSYY